MTTEIFRKDAYQQSCEATVVAVDERGVQFDQSVFYPAGGGQPGDSGTCVANDHTLVITNTIKDPNTGEQIHIVDSQPAGLSTGDSAQLTIDWERRYRLMRMHSCLHMLCAVVPAPVTGGSIQDGRGRLDFDLPDTVDKQLITEQLNALITSDHPMTLSWITDEELAANPDLVRTLSAPPPTGSGTVRLVNFEGIDCQPCGGTHVASTGEIGPVLVKKIEKKGKMNRRITVVFDD
ncbi:MAG: alanyl-tRNA editing protein [Pseudomonadota bacterium]